jgi:hypothetical protein
LKQKLLSFLIRNGGRPVLSSDVRIFSSTS